LCVGGGLRVASCRAKSKSGGTCTLVKAVVVVVGTAAAYVVAARADWGVVALSVKREPQRNLRVKWESWSFMTRRVSKHHLEHEADPGRTDPTSSGLSDQVRWPTPDQSRVTT
jgi:hypothetical protein